jgi:hypothetical protein
MSTGQKQARLATEEPPDPAPGPYDTQYDKIQRKAPPATDPAALCLTPAQWEAREIEPAAPIVGHLITNETRILFSLDTGKGKTQIGLALAFAAYLGTGFLHWHPGSQCRVLFVDGELPAGVLKRRLATAASWFDLTEPPTEGLYVLSTADVPDFKPLDTAEGRAWLDEFIKKLGGVNLIIFDNLQSLTSCSLKEADSWLAMKPWVFGLTARHIGQFWLHHTGLDTSRGYGDKAREWGMDTVMIGEAVEAADAGVSVSIRFTKARNRDPDDPDSRAQFDPVHIQLRAGQWTSSATVPTKKTALGKNQKLVYDAATKLLAGSDRRGPRNHPANGHLVVSLDAVKNETRRIMAADPKHFSSTFNLALNGLASANRLNHYDGLIWLA